MREILFRGKRTDTGEWVHGAFVPDALETPCDDCLVSWGFIRRYNRQLRKMETIEVDRETIGQFTGLTDKNGKRIFEGDILDCGDRIVYVKWHEKRGQWDSEFIRYVRELSSNGITTVEWKFRAEKIGNIHDNPELLRLRQL